MCNPFLGLHTKIKLFQSKTELHVFLGVVTHFGSPHKNKNKNKNKNENENEKKNIYNNNKK